jgi:hypothetical protein
MICPIDNKKCYTTDGKSEGNLQVDICRHGKRYRDGAKCPAQIKFGLFFESLKPSFISSDLERKQP